MKITHYAARNLRDFDDTESGFDVVAKGSDGTYYYSEDVFDDKKEAQAFIDRRVEDNPGQRDYWTSYWEGNALDQRFVHDTMEWRAA